MGLQRLTFEHQAHVLYDGVPLALQLPNADEGLLEVRHPNCEDLGGPVVSEAKPAKLAKL